MSEWIKFFTEMWNITIRNTMQNEVSRLEKWVENKITEL